MSALNNSCGKEKSSNKPPSFKEAPNHPSPLMSKLLISGYQSLYSVQLDLGLFTVIHGESNVGKSALYRALRGLFISETGDDFISYGEEKSGVAIQLSDGVGIAWIKKRGQGPIYRLDDKVWKRVRGVPDEIKDILRINSIDVSGDYFYPNLRGQFDGLFLLFDSTSKRAKVLGSLVSNFLLGGIREANLERNRNEADARSIEGILDGIKKEQTIDWKKHKETAQGLVDLEVRIEKSKEIEKQIRQYQIDLGLQKSLSKKIAAASELQQKVLNEMKSLEELLKTDTLLRQEVKRWKSLKGFRVPAVEFLPEEFFVRVDKYVNIRETIEQAMDKFKSNQVYLESAIFDVQNGTKELEVAEKEMKEAEKGAMVVCPLCKGSYSILKLEM